MASKKVSKKFDNLKYAITRVKTISFFANEPIYYSGKEAKIEIDQNFGLNIEAGILDFRLRVYMFYLDQPKQFLTEIIVQNTFKIEGLGKHFKDGILTLPPPFVLSIITLSISHTRALLCQNTAGTVYQDYVLPITNAADVSKVFFPQMFDETGKLRNEMQFKLDKI